MFNATNARTAVASAIEADSDLFAAELEDRFEKMSISEQQALMRKLREVVSDQASAAAFAQGVYAQTKDGSAANALGTGSTPTEDETKKALALVLGSPHIDTGVKHLLRRAFDQAAPDHIPVEPDGTPSEIKNLQKQVQNLTKECDKAKTELDDERDDAKPGSLAHRLAATSGGALDTLTADVRTRAEAAKAAIDSATDTIGGAKKLGKSSHGVAERAIDEIIDLVS